jgi:hypothetical protein
VAGVMWLAVRSLACDAFIEDPRNLQHINLLFTKCSSFNCG